MKTILWNIKMNKMSLSLLTISLFMISNAFSAEGGAAEAYRAAVEEEKEKKASLEETRVKKRQLAAEALAEAKKKEKEEKSRIAAEIKQKEDELAAIKKDGAATMQLLTKEEAEITVASFLGSR